MLPIESATGPKLDNRTEAIKHVATWMEDLLRPGGPTLDDWTIEVMIVNGSLDPDWRGRQLAELHRHRVTRSVGDPAYQEGFRRQMYRQWGEVGRAHTDLPVMNIHQHLFPSEGRESYLLWNKAVFLKSSLTEGDATLIEGPRGSGKTFHAAYRFEVAHNLFLEWKATNEESLLWQSARMLGLRMPGKAQLRHLEDEASIGPENLPEKKHREWKRVLGILGAKKIQWVTNIGVDRRGPHGEAVVYAPAQSTLSRAVLQGDLDGAFTIETFDEASAFANNKRQMKTGYIAFEQNFNTFRKDNASEEMITQTGGDHSNIPDYIREQCQTRILTRKGGATRYFATFTIHGLFRSRAFRDIPLTGMEIDTQDRGTYVPDLLPSNMWGHVSELRWKAIEDGQEWTHRDAVIAALEYIKKNAKAKNEIAAGDSGYLSEEIRHYFTTPDPATGAMLSPKRIAQELTDPESGIEITENRVVAELEKWKAQQKELERTTPKEARRQSAAYDPDEHLPEPFVDTEG